MTAVLTPAVLRPGDVRDVLARSILADGLDFVLDIDRSSGSYLVDARTGERYLDMFVGFLDGTLAPGDLFSGEEEARAADPDDPFAA